MGHTARSLRGMVSAPHHLAAQAGRDVLREGGNAVEAAVAVAATLAVVYPHMTGIGGDGFWLVAHRDGRTQAIDACGRAAARADRALYAGHAAIPWRGPLAANTVAGTVSGWQAALDLVDSRLPRQHLLHAAIAHAEAGVAITTGGAAIAAAKGAELRDQPGAYAATFEPHGRPLAAGEVLRQPALATTLRMLADDGFHSFYRGALAGRIAADLAALGSPVAAGDLAAHRALTVAPLRIAVGGDTLFNTPPPTQGLAALLILALFDRLGVTRGDGFAHVHGLVEATKQAFRIRDRHIGDPTPDFDAQALLDDGATLDAMAAAIDPVRAAPWPQPAAPGDTTWFGAADGDGLVVSAIQSIYFEFGAGLVLPQTGICWQNRGASFTLGHDGPRALRPGAKPFHTLNPALARLGDGRVLAYGTMGGEGQPQTQAALFTRYRRFGHELHRAIAAPRWLLGRTWGEDSTSLKIEEGFAPALYAALEEAGHRVERVPLHDPVMGHAGAVLRHRDGRLEGASDPRSDGIAAAW